MKKTPIVLALGFLLTTYAVGGWAAPQPQKQGGNNSGPGQKQMQSGKEQQLKTDAKYIIDRTAKVLEETQRIAKKGRHYSGFGQAVAHQEKARELYRQGHYQDAIAFSLRARELSLGIIRGNKEKPRPEFEADQREKAYQNGPKGKDLDAKLDQKQMKKDKDAISIKIELNI